MPRTGRPTRAAAANRRAEVVRFLAEVAQVHDDVLRQLSEHVGADVRTIRSDLRLIVTNRVAEAPTTLSAELARELEAATNTEALASFQRRLAIERAAGRITVSDARYFSATCRELQRTLPPPPKPPESAEDIIGRVVAKAAKDFREPAADDANE